ncbi:patched domain-containing protein 3-like [Babylonia areolata]|uniref:patched domain-containing protein 3-like n=1 Tax=Babylonia areolata TaxID=304850 RepID=UPI003FD41208
MGCSDAFHCVSRKISEAFGWYGRLVGRYPLPFVILPVLVCGGLAIGFMFRENESDIEALYTPMDSRSRADREEVKRLFPDGTGTWYNPMNLNDHPLGGSVLFRHRAGSNLLTPEVLGEIRDLSETVKTWTWNRTRDEGPVTYEEVCGRLEGACLVWGQVVLTEEFWQAYLAGTLTFPFWDSPWGTLDLSMWLGNVNRTEMDVVLEARAIKVTFTLRQDTDHLKELSLLWEKAFIHHMQQIDDDSNKDDGDDDGGDGGRDGGGFFKNLLFAFSSSQSLGSELDKGTKGDITYFSFTFTLMITYASMVSSGGDCVSTRALLANAGVLAATMGIMACFGLFAFVGVQFVNIVGVVPFLVLGIGVDDMFLLMSGWSSTQGQRDLSVPERIGATFRAAGIGITITSITDFLAFAIGSTSVFLSVRNFCIYSGVAVLFCYICNATFFGGCLALHGRRVYGGRHTLTCKKIRPRKEMSDHGERCCLICMCGGATPQNAYDDESPFEKGPRVLLPRLVLWTPVKVLVVAVFAGYLAVSVWGIMEHLEQGLCLKDLVLQSSYYHRFNTWDEENFGVAFPVAFAITEPVNYTDQGTVTEMLGLIQRARQDPDISPVGTYCWFTEYLFSPDMDISSPRNFVISLRDRFLPDHPRYMNDVVFDADNSSVLASRCHVFSKNVVDSTRQAELMIRMRELADSAPLPTFAYQPAFVYFEQYVTIMRSTLQTVGITLAVMFFVTFLFLVHPVIVLLVFLNILMIIVGIFGFMGLWGLTLSSVTMIHLIMSVGFSVDFSAHVCSAYMLSGAPSREERARYALVHASGPILNSGLSSLIGIVILVFSDSYIFQSFFKIMTLVIGFGVLHAVFLIPVLLSWIGPVTKGKPGDLTTLSASSKNRPSNGCVSTLAYKKRDSTTQGDHPHSNGQTAGGGPDNGEISMAHIVHGTKLMDCLGYMGHDNKAFASC